ncbi:MAG: TauD/TfdA family dioxygenase [Campylobacteraceae bacterium]|nr:TauD/TfdA family dioxygenase [Campylobacteraceae bacterium]
MKNLPQNLETPAAWKGSQMISKKQLWIWQLQADESKELLEATKEFLQSDVPLENISKYNFKLTTLEKKLSLIKDDLTKGIGFKVIRGLTLNNLSREEVATIFMGIGAHIGVPRSQNAKGHLLGHVRNVGADVNDTNSRIYQTNQRQTFHTDSTDVVALICLQTAQSGGESLLVSAETIYNEMLKRRPDLAKLLFENIATDKRGEIEPGKKPYFSIPVFSWYKEKLSVIYQRQYIESAQRFDEVPNLTPLHIEALDLFDELANDSSLNISMQLQKGDMQFVHNHSMLHDRGSFIDWPQLEKRRHLLRLWLSVPEDRELPAIFSERFGTTTVGNRGGIILENTKPHVPLD